MEMKKVESQTSPLLPWKTRISLKLLSAVTYFSSRHNGTVNRRLLNFFDVKASPNGQPLDGVKTSDVTVDSSRNLWFRLFVPVSEAHARLPVLVFFHGGGFAYLGADSKGYDAICRLFARELPAVVVSVNYRLAPEHRFPCQYDDGYDVLKFLDDGRELPENADLTRCFLAGDSAGGNLAHHVVRRACEARFKDLRVIGLIAIQPFFGGEERTVSELRFDGAPVVSLSRTDWMWKSFLPEGSDRDHEAANVCGGADISGVLNFPATVVLVGGFDPLQDWQRRYYEWLKRSGKEAYLVEYPNAVHAFYGFPELPEYSLLFAEVRDFVEKQSSSTYLKSK